MGKLKHILIDGDLLVYQASSAVQKELPERAECVDPISPGCFYGTACP